MQPRVAVNLNQQLNSSCQISRFLDSITLDALTFGIPPEAGHALADPMTLQLLVPATVAYR
jgi:hypothetical protein